MGIRGLFGDSGPFSGICGLFGGFTAFSRICTAFFAVSQPFRGFAAFLQIRGFTAKGVKGVNEPPGETFAT